MVDVDVAWYEIIARQAIGKVDPEVVKGKLNQHRGESHLHSQRHRMDYLFYRFTFDIGL